MRNESRLGFVAFLVVCWVVPTGCGGGNGDESENDGPKSLDDQPEQSEQQYVTLPGGVRVHPSCVVEVEADATIESDGTVVRADGTRRTLSPCAFPTLDARGSAAA